MAIRLPWFNRGGGSGSGSGGVTLSTVLSRISSALATGVQRWARPSPDNEVSGEQQYPDSDVLAPDPADGKVLGSKTGGLVWVDGGAGADASITDGIVTKGAFTQALFDVISNGDNIVVHRNVSTSVTFLRLLNNHIAGGSESPNHAMWLLTTGTYDASLASINYSIKPDQFYYVAPRSNQAHLLLDLSNVEGSFNEEKAVALINTAFANGIQLWARTAPANEDEHGNQIYPAADVLADDAVKDYVLTPNSGGALVWGLLTENSLVDAVKDKLALSLKNAEEITSIQSQIRSLERHGSPNNFRLVPSAVDEFTDIDRTYRVQVLNTGEIPSNVDKLVVMVGDVGGALGEGTIVDAVRSWDRSSQFSFTITDAQRRFFEPSIVDQTQLEIRFLLLPNDYTIPNNIGATSLGEIVQTDLAVLYIGEHGGVPRVIQSAVNGVDGAGVTFIELPENYTSWKKLHIAIYEGQGDDIISMDIHTSLLSVQGNNRDFLVDRGAAGANPAILRWTTANRRLTRQQNNDTIIYAILDN